MGKRKATLIGLLAILLWSSIVGLIRAVSESFGPVGGAALIYTLASVLLLFSIGATRIRELPGRYLFWGSLLFVAYELCLSLSIGYAAWNVGILHGHVTLLAGASYFIPVLSAALAAMLLGASFSAQFWQGAAMVCVGSILCWWATRPARMKETG